MHVSLCKLLWDPFGKKSQHNLLISAHEYASTDSLLIIQYFHKQFDMYICTYTHMDIGRNTEWGLLLQYTE